MNVLVLQPTRPTTPDALCIRAMELLEAMIDANPAMTFDVISDRRTIEAPPHRSKYLKHALLRNALLDDHLRADHTHVLWIDSDLIDYPADLPTQLHEANPGGITAPLALLAATVARRLWDEYHGLGSFSDRFYDIGGYVERGHSARVHRPFFEQTGDVIDMDSVGCCYLAPASLYRDGVRYAPPERDQWADVSWTGRARREYRVEHYSVMREAAARGIRIACLTTVAAVHAWLPDYGLEVS